MRKTFYQRHKSFFETIDGLLLANPVLERGLVLAPIIVASYNTQNAVVLGIAFTIITCVSVFLSSFIPRSIPYTIRTIMYTLIACVVFIPTAIYLEMLFPETVYRLGVFLPLLVANSLIVVKSESRFHKRKKAHMLLDLICQAIGFFMVIIVVGAIREFLANGTLFGVQVSGISRVPAIVLPFSGFIIVGFLAAAVKRLRYIIETPREVRIELKKQARAVTGGDLAE